MIDEAVESVLDGDIERSLRDWRAAQQDIGEMAQKFGKGERFQALSNVSEVATAEALFHVARQLQRIADALEGDT